MGKVINFTEKLVGTRVGFGQCGSLTSAYFESLTGFNFADYVTNPAPILPTAPQNGYFANAWDVYTQLDWEKVGWEYINNPRIDQLREDDIFFLPPNPNMPDGHTGLIASISGGQPTTYEQNWNSALYVQKLSAWNSWNEYGFGGIVRPKSTPKPPKPQPNTGEENMLIVQTKENNYVITADGYYTWIADGAVLKALQSKLPTITMDDGRMRGMFVNISQKKAVDNMQKEITAIKKSIDQILSRMK